MCSGRVGSSCFTNGTRRVTLVTNPVKSLRKIDLSSLNKLHYLGAILYLVNRVSDTAFPHDINKCHKGTLTCPLYLGVYKIDIV